METREGTDVTAGRMRVLSFTKKSKSLSMLLHKSEDLQF